MKIQADIIIENGMLITVNARDEVLPDHSVVVREDRILDIGPSKEIGMRYQADKTIDASRKIIMPGLINTHTHSAMTLFRGFADDIALENWLNRYIFPAEARFTDAAFVRTGTRLAVAEMLLSGTTAFNDMYYFQKAAAEETTKMGMRAVFSESLADFPVPGSTDYKAGLKYTEELISEYRNHPLISPAVAVHAPYSADAEILQTAKALSDSAGLLFNIHVSETQWESEIIRKKHGKSSAEWLNELHILNERTVAAHSVHLSPNDIEIFKFKKVGVAHNPECNMKIASGAAPITEYLKKGIKVGLGTDGVASNNNLDLFEEMHSMALLHKLKAGDPTVLSARQAVRIATMGSAEVLGLQHEIGSVEIGKKADLITIDIDNPRAVPMYDPYSVLVYSLNGSDVQDSVVNGQLLMQNRRLLDIDIQEITTEAKRAAQRIEKAL